MISLVRIGDCRAVVPIIGNIIPIGISQGISATIGGIRWTKVTTIGNAICVSIDIIGTRRANIAIITHAIAIGIRLKRIGFKGAVIGTVRNYTGCVSKTSITHTIVIGISACIARISETIIIMIRLSCIGYGRAIIPIVRNIIAISICQCSCASIGRICRAEIAAIRNTIVVGIKNI